ncbi:DUF3039 domain-containing protein [Kocuria flava]|uniref:DUF3039 domain-containing protein n=1 Tax=Kocuria flava TaxID=446860 RepID=A0ABQ0X8I0_9MICC|nr:DUF3039 domain-containing protein [Kocuria flava]MCJ8504974.1 DUF3039 domain-containing protein [Kocuria flava]GEO93710.1 hypothetical protein KFL01_30160 [Kocuria flava]
MDLIPASTTGTPTSGLDDSPYGTDPARPAGGTSTIEREETRELQEPGDHERFAHYVRKEKIMESALSGEPVIALCGKVWLPGRDPSRFPVCPTCKEIYEGLRPGQDDDQG